MLRQRNALLRRARGEAGSSGSIGGLDETLAVFDEQLVRHGATLLAARLAAVNALAGPVDRAYRDVADHPDPITMTYVTSTGAQVVGETSAGVPDPGGPGRRSPPAPESERLADG